ncbi:MAG: SDR family NAD(P)-dependent oxidoreductase, partial [Mycobacterium sp.]
LDVTKPEQIASAVRQAQERFGGVDVLVNNAGYGYRAAVEEGDDTDVRTLFETHFFGTIAMIKAVLPGMRARRRGAIVNISSIGVQLTPMGSGYYSAAKAAIEGVSGALRGELAPLGISVTVVEPGAFRTDFAGRSLIQSATVIDDYAATAGQRRKEHDTMHGNQPGDPAKAGAAIIAAVESSEPPAFLLLGADALAVYRYIADGRANEIAKWEQLTTSTNFDS